MLFLISASASIWQVVALSAWIGAATAAAASAVAAAAAAPASMAAAASDCCCSGRGRKSAQRLQIFGSSSDNCCGIGCGSNDSSDMHPNGQGQLGAPWLGSSSPPSDTQQSSGSWARLGLCPHDLGCATIKRQSGRGLVVMQQNICQQGTMTALN